MIGKNGCLIVFSMGVIGVPLPSRGRAARPAPGVVLIKKTRAAEQKQGAGTTVTRLVEIKDDRNQYGEAAEVLENFKERPAAQHIRDPLKYPFDCEQWYEPGMP